MDRRGFLKTAAQGAVLVGAGGLLTRCGMMPDLDLIIRGGFVIDGAGKERFRADVGITADRIRALGDLSQLRAARVVDADGLVVAPGFIDYHSHTDLELFVNPRAESKIRQGVTTEIIGQDGSSQAPLNARMSEEKAESFRAGWGQPLDAGWTDLAGFFNRLRRNGTAVNIGSMVGLGTLREAVVGMDDRPATTKEIERMGDLAVEAVRQGACGISSGLEYTPGSYASTEELAEVCSRLAPFNLVYSTHMRNEDNRLEEAVAEAILIARRSGLDLNISHLKASGKKNWHKLDNVFGLMDDARVEGMRITCDRYPYEAYNTGLSSLFPLWARDGGAARFLERLGDESLIPRIRDDVLAKVNTIGSWNSVLISGVNLEEHRKYQGRRVAELVEGNDQAMFSFVRDLMVKEKTRVSMCGFAMSAENTLRVLSHHQCMVASDGSALATYGPLSEGHPHPRAYGTFPRVMGKYVRDEAAFTLEDVVRKCTSLPAERAHLSRRGLIARDHYADIVVFDPETIDDRATWSNSAQYPVGIEYVLVNGRMVVERGQHTGRLPGRVLAPAPVA